MSCVSSVCSASFLYAEAQQWFRADVQTTGSEAPQHPDLVFDMSKEAWAEKFTALGKRYAEIGRRNEAIVPTSQGDIGNRVQADGLLKKARRWADAADKSFNKGDREKAGTYVGRAKDALDDAEAIVGSTERLIEGKPTNRIALDARADLGWTPDVSTGLRLPIVASFVVPQFKESAVPAGEISSMSGGNPITWPVEPVRQYIFENPSLQGWATEVATAAAEVATSLHHSEELAREGASAAGSEVQVAVEEGKDTLRALHEAASGAQQSAWHGHEGTAAALLIEATGRLVEAQKDAKAAAAIANGGQAQFDPEFELGPDLDPLPQGAQAGEASSARVSVGDLATRPMLASPVISVEAFEGMLAAPQRKIAEATNTINTHVGHLVGAGEPLVARAPDSVEQAWQLVGNANDALAAAKSAGDPAMLPIVEAAAAAAKAAADKLPANTNDKPSEFHVIGDKLAHVLQGASLDQVSKEHRLLGGAITVAAGLLLFAGNLATRATMLVGGLDQGTEKPPQA